MNDAHGLEAVGTLRTLYDLKRLVSIVLLVDAARNSRCSPNRCGRPSARVEAGVRRAQYAEQKNHNFYIKASRGARRERDRNARAPRQTKIHRFANSPMESARADRLQL